MNELTTNEEAAIGAVLDEKVGWAVGKLLELAEGIYYERVTSEGHQLVYKTKPDKEVLMFLIERKLGKVGKGAGSAGNGGNKVGMLTIQNIIQNMAVGPFKTRVLSKNTDGDNDRNNVGEQLRDGESVVQE